MVSIKDIAASCGVSAATVSKALNGQADVGPQTRRRILQAARAMGYMPNSAARALKTNRTYDLGVLFADEADSGLMNEYFSAVLNAFRGEAERRGYDITFINRNIGVRRASYLEHCRYRGVDGVAAACVDFTDPDVLELIASGLPVVTVDKTFAACPSVLSDNAEGVRQLVHHLVTLGHRRIACIHGESHSAVTEQRMAGFCRACADHGLSVPQDYVRAASYHDAAGCAAQTRLLLALSPRPTAILFPDDFSALGGMRAVQEAGLAIPGDCSVCGYDGVLLASVMSPPLTTYRQNTGALGRMAADRLIAQIEHPDSKPGAEPCVVNGELEPGGTAAPPREKNA
jgi:DNA-binding LacI/PurR family transcriptional regulator